MIGIHLPTGAWIALGLALAALAICVAVMFGPEVAWEIGELRRRRRRSARAGAIASPALPGEFYRSRRDVRGPGA